MVTKPGYARRRQPAGAFPLAYAIVLEALTIPLLIMLLALIFRGVAFEFRFKSAQKLKPFWDKALCSDLSRPRFHRA